MARIARRIRRAAGIARLAWRKRGLLVEALESLGQPEPVVMLRPNAATRDIYIPLLPVMDLVPQPRYMVYSTCSAADFLDPRFLAASRLLGQQPRFHRKLWEFVYVYHHLDAAGMLAPGRRGIGFGVGNEPLPAVFAARGAEVVATDAPPDVGHAARWAASGEFAGGKASLLRAGLCDEASFDRLISFRHVDMNAIPQDLSGFDFCWSACCFEHLGTIQAGLDFVANTVERVLKPGGVAVHTTEFNLASNVTTLETGGTVIYRRRDLEALMERLRARGHEVAPLRIAPDSHPMDGWVDVPPYSGDAHLKLALGEFTATSVGLVIRRGP
jgi:SAM-dependent methyltransferase